jgi:hypothetical protein
LAPNCHNNSKKERVWKEKERVWKEKGVRWSGRSIKALEILRFIAGISLISTLLVIYLHITKM